MSKTALTDDEGEVRELLADDIAAMRPAAEVLPADLVAVLPASRSDTSTILKGDQQVLSLPVDHDVVEHFKSAGPGWQSRMNQALRKAAGL